MPPRSRSHTDIASAHSVNDSDLPILPPGYRLIARDVVGSTNDEARELIAAGASQGAVVWAQSQTAGRGRHGRDWISPPGNLYCSIIMRPKVEPAHLAEIAFVAALSVRDAIAPTLPSDVPVEFKWPNDVLAGGRKVSGILVEAEKLPDEARTALIVGVGVNIVSAPREAAYPATCISALTRAPRVARLLTSLVAALDRRVELWTRNGFAAIRQEWMDHAYGVGGSVTASSGISGTFTGLDETGAIIIATKDGEQRRLVSGSVRFSEMG
jgi:BirA family biotin operon repressor/biotin-[acetyl-CoA-carboxylase] ligase